MRIVRSFGSDGADRIWGTTSPRGDLSDLEHDSIILRLNENLLHLIGVIHDHGESRLAVSASIFLDENTAYL